MHTSDNDFSPDLLDQQLSQPDSFLPRGEACLVHDLQAIYEQKKSVSLDQAWERLARLRNLPYQGKLTSEDSERELSIVTQPLGRMPARRRGLPRLFQVLAALLVVGLLVSGFLVELSLRQETRSATSPTSTTSSQASACQPYALKSFPIASSTPASNTFYLLMSVSAVSASNAWAVGFYAPDPVSSNIGGHTLIEHWDGQQWQTIASPNAASGKGGLLAVAAVSADDVWAVGGSSQGSQLTQLAPTGSTLIEHWDGRNWQVVPSPNSPYGNGILKALTVVSKQNIWAVGSYNDDAHQPHPLVEHWNGVQWSIVTPQNDSKFVGWLNAVVAPSADELWAVGSSLSTGKSEGLILHGNTGAWQFQTVPTSQLTSISALSADDLWAVSTAGFKSQVEHWTGQQWQNVLSKSESLAYDLTKIVALSDNDLWATGSSSTPNQVFPAIILHWNGQTWQSAGSPMAGANFQDLAISSSHQLWVVGELHGSAFIMGQQTCP